MPSQTLFGLTTSGQTGLLFKDMLAEEELGRLFEFDVLAVAPSESIQAEDLLGTPASVSVELADGSSRYFHGLVCAMGIEGTIGRMFCYRLILRPWLWLMTRRSDTRVFQEVTLEQILKAVFKPFSDDYQFQLSGVLPKYDYCVQYRETDFDFISRLMEQEGIYYYFRHEAGKHTMVIVNSPSAHQTGPYQETFQYRELPSVHAGMEPITQWKSRREIQSGQVVLRDYDFTRPKVSLETVSKATRNKASAKLEVYDYPGIYSTKAEGDRYSRLRVEELQARYARIDGSGPVRGLACGYRFTLAGHPRVEENQAHLVVSSRVECSYSGYASASETTSYQCHFTAIPGNEIFRPKRRTAKPSVAGVHTAIVVGPAGEEIHTDQHGRVKVQFHWDRLGKSDEKSSCWVRVSSPLAGQSWGMIALPRTGQEVVVDFLEGDPDRPLITGRVYNGGQKPPYALPDHGTVSTNKSHSSKGGGTSDFNELRFEDKAGQEQVWLQAQKDFHQRVKNDLSLEVMGNQQALVSKDRTEKVDGAVQLKVGKDLVHEVTGAYSVKTSKDFIADSSLSISLHSGTDLDTKIGNNFGLDAGVNVHIKAGVNVVIEAGVMLTLKAGGSSLVLGPAGVMVNGSMVMINSGGGGGSGGGANPKAGLTVTPPQSQKDPLA